jgi:hypothetical protein
MPANAHGSGSLEYMRGNPGLNMYYSHRWVASWMRRTPGELVAWGVAVIINTEIAGHHADHWAAMQSFGEGATKPHSLGAAVCSHIQIQ